MKKTHTRLIILMVVLALTVAPMAFLTGCTSEPSATNSPAATPTDEPEVEYGPYKDVLIVADYVTGSQLEPNAYSIIFKDDGTFEGPRINGDINNMWGTGWFIDDPLIDNEEYNPVRYFCTGLSNEDLLDATKVQPLIDNGDLPMIVHSPNLGDFPIPSTLKKVIIIFPFKDMDEGYIFDNGLNSNWADWIAGPVVKRLIKLIKYSVAPNAEIILTSMLPWNEDIGLFDAAKWPKSDAIRNNKQVNDPDGENYNPWWVNMRNSKWEEVNPKVQAMAENLGVEFLDLWKSELVNSNGWLKDEYTHVNGFGYQLSAAGLVKLGDILMEAADLPKPDEVHPEWYTERPIR